MKHAAFLVRLALPAAFALVLAGGAAAAAAPSHSGLTWHNFKLINGWNSASTVNLRTGTPGWALRNGIVYLRGAVENASPSASEMLAKLPRYARPAHNLYIQAYTSDAVAGTVLVTPDGDVDAYNGDDAAFTSLAGISYPLPSVPSHPLKLRNDWHSGQSTYNTGDPAYSVVDGVVYLSGSLIQGTKPVNDPFRLPKAARPSHQFYRSVYTFDGATGSVAINPAGEFAIFGASSGNYTSLAGISYPVASTKWHKFTLVNGWRSGATKYHSAAPSYAVVNGVVFLDGTMFQTSGHAPIWTVLPAAARPADTVEIEVETYRSSAGGLELAKSANVSNVTFSNSQQVTSFGAVAYPVSS